jgi:hypothetical protein
MDTEHATSSAKKYQWEALAQGDIDKALLVRWEVDGLGRYDFKIHSRIGSSSPLEVNNYYYLFDRENGPIVEENQLKDIVLRIQQAADIG